MSNVEARVMYNVPESSNNFPSNKNQDNGVELKKIDVEVDVNANLNGDGNDENHKHQASPDQVLGATAMNIGKAIPEEDNRNNDPLKKTEEKEINKDKDDDEAKPVINIERILFFSRLKRNGVFFFIIIINIIANFDDGTIPSATEEISRDLKLKKDEVGLLGTLVYVGNLIGRCYF